MGVRFIFTEKANPPAGHYSQATVANGFIFVAGQLPIKPDGQKVLGSVEEQTLQVLENLKNIVEAAGGSLETVVKTTVYIVDIELWPRVNQVYAAFFNDHKPARAVVPVPALHYGFLIEVEAVAMLHTA